MSALPFDQRDGFIWFNGKMVPWKEANIHVLSHGLHYASSVFEGERVYNGNIFKLAEHTERLIESGRILDMKIPFSVAEIDKACQDIIVKNNITDGYIRPVAWRGAEQMGVSAQNSKINLAIAAWEWPSYFDPAAKENGIKLKTAPWLRPDPRTIPVRAKAAGLYMICTISKHTVEREGFHDALFHDFRGYVAEATGANIFLVMNGEVHTPMTDCILDGITRRTVIDLAKKRNFKVIERHIKPEELKNAQEVFLTGTAAEVTAVGLIDNLKFTVGPVTRQLRDDYEKLVRSPSVKAA